MFTKSITLFRLFGFAVKIDVTWLFLVLLVIWTLAEGVFPYYFPGLTPSTYWWMGAVGAIGLFVSIVLHEFGHSLVARRFGIPIKEITLFIFGGVADMEEEPPSAKSEFVMAVAGPITSVVLAFVFLGLYLLGSWIGEATAFFAVIAYLAWLNILLAIFNMIPAFPLDGGRVLRAALWGWTQNLAWSTKVAAGTGTALGITLAALGVLAFFSGNVVGGVWWVMIGVFIVGASRVSYRQVLLRRALEGETIRRFMQTNPVTVPETTSLSDWVSEFVYRYHFKMFPVTRNEILLGCVTTRHLKDIPQAQWPATAVREIMEPCSPVNSIGPDENAMKGLSVMSKTQNSRLMVVEQDRLLGIISLKDLLGFLSLKMDLEQDMG